MNMIIKELKPNNDCYTPEQINCFEKPIGIVLDSYLDGISSLYYLILKYHQSYNTGKYLDRHGSKYSLISLNILDEYFNLNISHEIPKGSLDKYIAEQIQKKNRIMIPCNLKELYYSNHYKTNDWPHLLLVKGFNQIKNIYYILDDVHLQNDYSQYKDFVISDNLLKELYYSYCNVYNEKKIIVVSKDNNGEIATLKILKKFLVTYCNDNCIQPYRELDFIILIMDYLNQNIPLDERYTYIMNKSKEVYKTINYKKVFFYELNKTISLFIVNNEYIQDLYLLSDKIINEWSKAINLCLVNLKRKKVLNTDKLDFIIQLEKEYKDKAMFIIENIIKNDKSFIKENIFNNTPWIIENNRNVLIEQNDNNIIFKFSFSDRCNIWVEDDAPKLLIYNSWFLSDSSIAERFLSIKEGILSFSVGVKVENDAQVCFMAGIIIKLKSDDIYIYGLEKNNRINVEKTGHVSSLFCVYEDVDNLLLNITINSEGTYLNYVCVDKVSKIIGKLNINIDDIEYIGLCCKKWSEGDLTVLFTEV